MKKMVFEERQMSKNCGNPDEHGVYYRNLYECDMYGNKLRLVARVNTHPGQLYPRLVIIQECGTKMMVYLDDNIIELVGMYEDIKKTVGEVQFARLSNALFRGRGKGPEVWWQKAFRHSEMESEND